jgi:hypothetical protein
MRQEEEEEAEEELEEFYCVACEKSFKSDRQLANHERYVAAHGERAMAPRTCPTTAMVLTLLPIVASHALLLV